MNQKNNAKSFTKIKYIVLEGSIKSKMNKKNITLKYISIILIQIISVLAISKWANGTL